MVAERSLVDRRVDRKNALLRSRDGQHWSTMKLPSNISEVISAYVSDDNDIWLEALDSRVNRRQSSAF